MVKIKSSRELAMERTAHLAAGGREALAYEQQKYIRAAEALAGSFLSEKATLEQVLESINRYPQEAAAKARQSFLRAIVAGADPGNIERAAAALNRCRDGGAESGSLAAAAESIRQRHRDSLAAIRYRAEQEGREALLKQLSAAGIGGSAVDGANPERSAWWQAETARAFDTCAAALADLKRQLLAHLGRDT